MGVKRLQGSYDPLKFEREILNWWDQNKIYDKIRASLKGNEKYYFLDGPPYPSSKEIHPGTCWNKILKDAVVRYKRARGFNVRDQPGYDCHGLPIEVIVEKELKFKTKSEIETYGVDKFVNKCYEKATENLTSITEQFKDLGISMDWDSPYLTYTDEYIESLWFGLKEIWRKGLLERGLKVVHWCPRCETTLADYEVSEYRQITDPSIFVKFPIEGRENSYIVIWTTTPWTLPANVAVMVHPDYDYIEATNGEENYIIAEGRLSEIEEETGVPLKVLRRFKGYELEGLRYRSPLYDEVEAQKKLKNARIVILSDKYVTLEEGTGCVHVAPGHGKEDYEVGHEEYGLPILMFVDEKGIFKEEAGKYAGRHIKDANQMIIEDLESKGMLLKAGVITHKYPVCWRCKTPLINRATVQWYVKVRKFKEKLIEEAMKVKWIPKWGGEERFRNWLEDVRDWVVSRQRYWGTPLPIWICDSCGKVHVVGSKRELENLSGFKVNNLHRPLVDNVSWKCTCGGNMKRVRDIVDVWYDSGMAHISSLGYPMKKEEFKDWWPVDFITEGHDQVAGWFFSLLRTGVLLFGKVPYKTVLMHGFMLDEKGREMHKSLGNYVSSSVIVDRYGRDPFRIFVLSATPWHDLKFSFKGLKLVRGKLNIVWNVYAFASTYMEGIDPFSIQIEDIEMEPEDIWLISKLQTLIHDVTGFMEEFSLHKAVQNILDFIIEDVSHFYIRVIRRRLWGGKNQDGCRYTLLYVLGKMLPLIAPFAPFIAEKIYQESWTEVYKLESVHMIRWPKPEEKLRNPKVEAEFEIVRKVVDRIMSLRSTSGLKLRQPIRSVLIIPSRSEYADTIRKYGEIIAYLANALNIELGDKPPGEGWKGDETEYGKVYINLRVDEKLRAMGFTGDVRRRIQSMRRQLGLTRGKEWIKLYVTGDAKALGLIKEFKEKLAAEVHATQVVIGVEPPDREKCLTKEFDINGLRVNIFIRIVDSLEGSQ